MSENTQSVYPSIMDVARVCHEANRALCMAQGDDSQPTWDDAPDWQKQSAIDGVCFHEVHPGASASASHENWMEHKRITGWTYGSVKDTEAKKHPCMVPFLELPRVQRLKDHLFRAIVHTLLINEDNDAVQGKAS